MTENRRKHSRLPVSIKTVIELESPGAQSSAPGRQVTCQTLNISREGLQVKLEQEVPVGAILHIGVKLPSNTETLYLAAEVRWCVELKDDSLPWAAGFKILNSGDSGYDHWVEQITGLES